MDILSFFPESILILKMPKETSNEELKVFDELIVYKNSYMEEFMKIASTLYWNSSSQRFTKKDHCDSIYESSHQLS
jgi:hypothetical protein